MNVRSMRILWASALVAGFACAPNQAQSFNCSESVDPARATWDNESCCNPNNAISNGSQVCWNDPWHFRWEAGDEPASNYQLVIARPENATLHPEGTIITPPSLWFTNEIQDCKDGYYCASVPLRDKLLEKPHWNVACLEQGRATLTCIDLDPNQSTAKGASWINVYQGTLQWRVEEINENTQRDTGTFETKKAKSGPMPQGIPTLSDFALIFFALLIAGLAISVLRKRSSLPRAGSSAAS